MYFVTIVTHLRLPVLSRVTAGDVELSEIGLTVEACWLAIPQHAAGTMLARFVIMPTHLHGLVLLPWRDDLPKSRARAPAGSLQSIIGSFKSASSRLTGKAARPLWMTRFHDRVVRSPEELERMDAYIEANPRRWEADRENPASTVPMELRDPPWPPELPQPKPENGSGQGMP